MPSLFFDRPCFRNPYVIWIGLLVLTLCVCGAFLFSTPVNHDESFYWLFGKVWVEGHPPYTTYWDIKPPGLFALYAVAYWLSGNSFVGQRLLLSGAIWLTSAGLYSLGARFCKSRTIGLTAAVLYISYSLTSYGLSGEPDIFLPLFTTWAMFLVLRVDELGDLEAHSKQKQWLCLFFSGVLMGLGFTFKQTMAFEGLAIAIFIIIYQKKWLNLLFYILGTGIFPLLFCIYYFSMGELKLLMDSTFFFYFARNSLLDSIQAYLYKKYAIYILSFSIICRIFPIFPIIFIGLICLISKLNNKKQYFHFYILIIMILISQFMYLFLQKLMLYYYFFPLIGSFCILSSVCFHETIKRNFPDIKNMIGLGAVIIFPVLDFFLVSQDYKQISDPTVPAIASHLLQEARGRKMSLYVVDYKAALYQMTNFSPVTAYPLPMHLMCAFPLPTGVDPEREIRKIMAKKPDFIVASENHNELACEIPQRADLVLKLMGRNYVKDSTYRDDLIDGAVSVWRRKALDIIPSKGTGAVAVYGNTPGA